MIDLLIKGGEVIDGTGAPRRRADVAVEGDRIVAVGAIAAEAARMIDATDRVVTPGFVDVHTHYDAQVLWDGALTPSPLHGVTTVLSGNCGFTIAPLSGRAADQEYLLRMLARVEGMPLEALRNAGPWTWTSTAEYLDTIEGNLGPNAGFMVGHSALRRTVMGAAATSRTAGPGEIQAMGNLLHAGLEAGGIGFSSSWARTHNDAGGSMVPSRYAFRDELLALSRIAGSHQGTSLEFIPMIGSLDDWAVELMADMSVAAQRPLNWNVLVVNAANLDMAMKNLRAGDAAHARGGKVVGLTMPMRSDLRLSFATGFLLDAIPGWEEIMLLPRAEKLQCFRDPATRARLDASARAPENPMRSVVNWSTKVIFDVVASENRQYVGRTVGEVAAETSREPWDVLCEIALADDLQTSFGTPRRVDTDDDWRAAFKSGVTFAAVVGASDAGAHLDLQATFNYATVMLGEAVRKRSLLQLEEAVRLLTDVPARLYGLVDRGRIEAGRYADVVVLDPTTIGSDQAAMRFDLPGGSGRLYANSTGVEHVLVNGRSLVADGQLTSTRPGKVLRSDRDTRTPSLD